MTPPTAVPARPGASALATPRDRVNDGRMSTDGDTSKVDPREDPDPNSARKPREASSKDDAEAAAARAESPADDQPDDPDPS